jgi:peptidyl-prolyl cis-trans isomerase SurA
MLGAVKGGLHAQTDTDPAVDRIAAIVGNSVILRSQIEEEMFIFFRELNQPVPADTAVLDRVKRDLLDTLIATELIFQEAQRDTSINVTPLEVSDAADQLMRATRAQFKTEAEFQAELRRAGFQNPEDWRRLLLEQQRRVLIVSRFETNLRDKGILAPIPPTDRELRAYFAEVRDRLPPRPATVAFRQLVISPQPDSQSLARTLRLADSLVRELRAGADFAVAARRFSQDPGSAARGGDLEWFRRDGSMVREFEDAAFTLQRGMISEPIRTAFGYHIIQVERTQPTEVKARHILLMPEVDSASALVARQLADRIHAALATGASFDSLQNLHHDPAEARETEPIVDSLPAWYAAGLAGVDSGEVSPVFVIPVDAPYRNKFVIAKVGVRSVPEIPTYDQWRERLRTILSQSMGRKKYLAGLRAKTFVDIRPQP